MPALFWLIVVGLVIATAAAVALPSMRDTAERVGGEATGPRRLDPTDPDGAPARSPWPPWLGPGVLLAGGIAVSLILTWLVPGLGGLVLFIPLMLLGRWRRRRPPGPRGPGGGGSPSW